MYWTYRALSRTGEVIQGRLEGSRQDAIAFTSSKSLSVLEVKRDWQRHIGQWLKPKKLSAKAMAEFFEDFHNLAGTGISLGPMLVSLQETTKEPLLREVLAKAQERLRQGESLVESLCKDGAFAWIVPSTLKAGEQAGRLKDAARILWEYFKRRTDVQSKVLEAFLYPSLVFILLTAVVCFISFKVVPKLQSLLPATALHNPATQCILHVSFFLRHTWTIMTLGVLALACAAYYYARAHKQDFERFYYQWPLTGGLAKESDLALYFLNLSVLLESGVPLMKAMLELNQYLNNYVSHQLTRCREYMLGGMAFSEALKQDIFFPSVVWLSMRKAEETAQISQYCRTLSELFSKRTRSRMDALIYCVQPVLLGLGGVFLVTVALAFLVPIYGSLSKVAGG